MLEDLGAQKKGRKERRVFVRARETDWVGEEKRGNV